MPMSLLPIAYRKTILLIAFALLGPAAQKAQCQQWARFNRFAGCNVNGITFDNENAVLICDRDKGLRAIRPDGSCTEVLHEVAESRPELEYFFAKLDYATGIPRTDYILVGNEYTSSGNGVVCVRREPGDVLKKIQLPSGAFLESSMRDFIGSRLLVTQVGRLYALDGFTQVFSDDRGVTFKPVEHLFAPGGANDCLLNDVFPGYTVELSPYTVSLRGDSIVVRRQGGSTHRVQYKLGTLNAESCNQMSVSEILLLGTDTLVVIAEGDQVYATTDGGATWNRATKGTRLVTILTDGRCFVTDDASRIYQVNFRNNTTELLVCSDAYVTDTITSIVVNRHVQIATGSGFYWRSIDYGTSWPRIGPRSAYNVAAVSTSGKMYSLSQPMMVHSFDEDLGRWVPLLSNCNSYHTTRLRSTHDGLFVEIGDTDPMIRSFRGKQPSRLLVRDGPIHSLDSIVADIEHKWPESLDAAATPTDVLLATEYGVHTLAPSTLRHSYKISVPKWLSFNPSFYTLETGIHLLGHPVHVRLTEDNPRKAAPPVWSFSGIMDSALASVMVSSVVTMRSSTLVGLNITSARRFDFCPLWLVDSDGQGAPFNAGIGATSVVGLNSDGLGTAIAVTQRPAEYQYGPASIYVKPSDDTTWRLVPWIERLTSQQEKNIACAAGTEGVMYIAGRGLDSILMTGPPYTTYSTVALPTLGTQEWPLSMAIHKNQLYLGTTGGIYHTQLPTSVADEEEIPLYNRMGLLVAPNPCSIKATITLLQTGLPANRTLKLVSVMGQVVRDFTDVLPAESKSSVETSINVSDVPSGRYLLVFGASGVARATAISIVR